jgi:UDP-N-acetylglucosamine transferase subunit ALG13
LAPSSEIAGNGHRLLVFATVGTDHHRFDRLVRWVDDWARSAEPHVECFVQTGTSGIPETASSQPYLPRYQLQELMSHAAAVVCHGGPGTIVDCRRAGVKPIVVPRRRSFDEHVDDHQLLFARRTAASGLVELVETEERLRAVLDAVIADPDAYRIDVEDKGELSASIGRFRALADPLLSTRRAR